MNEHHFRHRPQVTYLMQGTNNLAGFLVYRLRAPVTVDVLQCFCNSVVLAEPKRMQSYQGQALVDPTVSSTEALHPFALLICAAQRRLFGHERKIRSSVWILELVVDSKLSIEAGEVTEEALQLWSVAIHQRSIDVRADGVQLLSLHSLLETGPKTNMAVWCGAMKRHAERILSL